jgi:hypothetical protein
VNSNADHKSEAEIIALVREFESGATAPAEFKHSAHLLVAFSYLHLSSLTVTEATERMRTSLYRYLEHHQVDRRKYNETITRFWIRLVRGFLDEADTTCAVPDLTGELLQTFNNSQLIYEYYSRERLSSEEAREDWIEPDLKPLDF